MRIYELDPPEGYEWILPENQDDFEVFRRFDGSARASSWTPVRVRLLKEDESQRFLPSDMPWLGHHAPVLKERAVDALKPALIKDGELLPLACDDADMWVFNTTTILDALDLDQSDLVEFSSGRIMRVKSYVFRSDRLRGVCAFKVPQLIRSSLFVTDEVVERASTLTGVGFKLLWDGSAQAA